MPLQLITPPAIEPVTLTEVLASIDEDPGLRDDELGRLIMTARQWVEQHCRRALMTQTWELVIERFANDDPLTLPPRGQWDPAWLSYWPWSGFPIEPMNYLRKWEPFIELPFGNLVSVSSVTYVDQGGIVRTMTSPADYSLDVVNVPGRIHPPPDAVWPVPRAQWDAVKIRYVVGFTALTPPAAPTTSTIPAPIKQAVIMIIGNLFRHGEPVTQPSKFSIESLLAPYKIFRL